MSNNGYQKSSKPPPRPQSSRGPGNNGADGARKPPQNRDRSTPTSSSEVNKVKQVPKGEVKVVTKQVPKVVSHGHIRTVSVGGLPENVCVVCYREVNSFSVGTCDHSVCFECSARMRVLLEQNECPICRHSLDYVVMTYGLKPFRELKDKIRMFIYLPKWEIYLENGTVHQDFNVLLEHRCAFCEVGEVFKDFTDLKSHVQRKHDLFPCDLCVEHIKLFSKERTFYTRADLGYHKRKGDRNDKSHRGHPLCQFCDKRYFDQDELYKHLRKDHYFCHFCDADGFNHYYNTYEDLRIHFRREHFLCEEEYCKDEKFTSVFRTEIDMKAHLTTEHSRLLGKHGVKQTRVIDLEFNIKSDDERRSRRFGGRDGHQDIRQNFRSREGYDEEGFAQSRPVFEPTITPQPKVDSVQEFPMLDGGASGTDRAAVGLNGPHSNSAAQKVGLTAGRNVSSVSKVVAPKWNAKSRREEDFPALGGVTSPKKLVATQQSSARGFMTAAAVSARPPPGPAPTAGQNRYGSDIGSNGRSGVLQLEEFPSLGNPSGRGANGSAWKGSGVKMKGQTPRHLKVAPAPLERKVQVDPSDQFHFVPLSVSRARKDSLSQKYEEFIDEPAQPQLSDDVKAKKKKKAGKVESATVKAADALFAGGGRPGGKKPLPTPEALNSHSSSPYSAPTDEFPSLEPVKKSLPSSSTKNPNIAGIRVAGPPPGFSAKPPQDYSAHF